MILTAMKKALVLLTFAAAILVAAVFLRMPSGRFSAPPPVNVEQALQLLRSRELAFLATHKTVSQIVVERRLSHPVLGKSECFLVGVVRFYHGVDFEKLDAGAIRREGDALIVRVPEPEELDFGVDLESIRVYTKRSGLMVLRDWASGTDVRPDDQGRRRSS